MTKKETLIAGVKRVGHLLGTAKKSNKKLSALALKESSAVIASAKLALRRERYLNARATKKCGEQRRAIHASVKGKSLSPTDAKEALASAVREVSKLKSQAKKIDAAIAAIDNIRRDLKTAGEENQMYKDDKGHGSDSAIPAPEKAEAVGADATGGSAPMDPEKAPPNDVKGKAESAPTGADGAIADGTVSSSRKARAQKLYARALALVKAAAKESDPEKRSGLTRKATIMEKYADNLVSGTARKTAGEKPGVADGTGPYGMKGDNPAKGRQKGNCPDSVKEKAKKKSVKRPSKKSAGTETVADKPVFAASDRVLLADGVVGTVDSVEEDSLVVSVAGVSRKVSAQSAKRITSSEAEKNTGSSIRDKIQSAISRVRSSRKKTADEPQPAIEGDLDDSIPSEAAPAPTAESPVENTVSVSETKLVDFVEGEGWVVNKSENEVVSFGEDKDAAERYVQGMKRAEHIRARRKAKVSGQKADSIIDSADHDPAEGQEPITKKMKGLDQKAKDYGKTSKEEKVNPDRSMVGKAGKKQATTTVKDSPVDSATTSKPDGTETVVQKLRGLTQTGKGYKTTKPDQKINPELSVFAKKTKVLEADNRKKTARLTELESSALVDRAIVVGAVDEAERSEQQETLAELYTTSPSEFKAYARLITQLEAKAEKAPRNRTHQKVARSMQNRAPVIVDSSSAGSAGSLDAGNFFDE